jgi:hypothetical protein
MFCVRSSGVCGGIFCYQGLGIDMRIIYVCDEITGILLSFSRSLFPPLLYSIYIYIYIYDSMSAALCTE